MAYTAETLAALMETELGATGVALFGVDPSVHAAIVDAVARVGLVLGESIPDLDDDLKTSTVARWLAWVTAEGAATNQYELGSDGSYLKRQQWWQQIRARRLDAEALASRYTEVQDVLAGSGGTAAVSHLATAGSPYAYPNYASEWS